jgi:hypothetical protein
MGVDADRVFFWLPRSGAEAVPDALASGGFRGAYFCSTGVDPDTALQGCSPESQRKVCDPINAFLGLGRRRNQQQIIDYARNREWLRNDQDSCAALAPDEFREVTWHGLFVMGDTHSTLFRCDFKDGEVAQACKPGMGCGLEVQAWRTTYRGKEDVLIKVGVRLKTDHGSTLSLRRGPPSLLEFLIPHGVGVTGGLTQRSQILLASL